MHIARISFAWLIVSLGGCSGATSISVQDSKETGDARPDHPSAPPPAPLPPRKGTIAGQVVFTGEVLPMQVPTARLRSPHCKEKHIEHDAIRVGPAANGCTEDCDGAPRPIADVYVRLPVGAVPAGEKQSAEPVVVGRRDCVSVPRMVALELGRPLVVENHDPIAHNVLGHDLETREPVFEHAQAAGGEPLVHTFKTPGLFRLTCDAHPWERTFVWVSDHPYVSITDVHGRFSLEDVPAGTYWLETWHPFYGMKRLEVTAIEGRPEALTIQYTGGENEPVQNEGELNDLF